MKKSFDFRTLQKYTSTQAFNDLNDFIENLPINVGNTLLTIGGIAWLMAGVTIVYANIESTKLQEMQADLYKQQALIPAVPKLSTQPVAKNDVEKFVERLQAQFEGFGIEIELNRSGSVTIQGSEGRQYGAFREAIGHLQNGGNGWRVNVESLCVGRECRGTESVGNSFLHGEFKITKIKVELPKN